LCGISYERFVRLIAGIARFLIPVKELAEIYFYNPNRRWSNIYDGFRSKYNLPDFLFRRKKRKGNTLTQFGYYLNLFHKAIFDNIGSNEAKEYKDLIFNAPLSEVLDYSEMK